MDKQQLDTLQHALRGVDRSITAECRPVQDPKLYGTLHPQVLTLQPTSILLAGIQSSAPKVFNLTHQNLTSDLDSQLPY